AMGINGIQEKYVVLSIAKEILRLNNDLDQPLDIYLTRYSDTLISLSDRTKLTKALNADLFLSLHCNHSNNPAARGIEVYVAKAVSKYSDDAIWFAFQLQDDLNKSLGLESRGVKFANFQVLRGTIDYCPAVLIELGFLSNHDEGNFISENNNIERIALSILSSIQKSIKL
ncbi:N-acetylmuramoyl-L-alanine amidase family protein, partial [Autumnicola edwardsiae]